MNKSIEAIGFSSAFSYSTFLSKIKKLTQHSSHSHEQTAYSLICDLEELTDNKVISRSEFATIIGKAADVLAYFRYDFDEMIHENTWYRASIIHQMGCGMLQVLRMMRPDLQGNNTLNESAYHLYCEQQSPKTTEKEPKSPRPIKGKNWLLVSSL